jgi:hypothetical protein
MNGEVYVPMVHRVTMSNNVWQDIRDLLQDRGFVQHNPNQVDGYGRVMRWYRWKTVVVTFYSDGHFHFNTDQDHQGWGWMEMRELLDAWGWGTEQDW